MLRALVVLVFVALAPKLAGADLIPEPTRPLDWDEHPPPSPPPPPEKVLPVVFWAVVLPSLGLGLVMTLRRPIARECRRG